MHKVLEEYPKERIVPLDLTKVEIELCNVSKFKKRGYSPGDTPCPEDADYGGDEEGHDRLANIISYLPKWANYMYLNDTSDVVVTKAPFQIHPDYSEHVGLYKGDGRVLAGFTSDYRNRRGNSEIIGLVYDWDDWPKGYALENVLIWSRRPEARKWWKEKKWLTSRGYNA